METRKEVYAVPPRIKGKDFYQFYPGITDRDQTIPDYLFLYLHNLGLKSQKSSLIQSVVTAVMTQAAALMRLPDSQAGLEPIGSLKR